MLFELSTGTQQVEDSGCYHFN